MNFVHSECMAILHIGSHLVRWWWWWCVCRSTEHTSDSHYQVGKQGIDFTTSLTSVLEFVLRLASFVLQRHSDTTEERQPVLYFSSGVPLCFPSHSVTPAVVHPQFHGEQMLAV